MLDGADGNVSAAAVTGNSGDRQIVSLGAAGCEDDFMRLRAHRGRDPAPRVVERGAGATSGGVNARRIPKRSGEDFDHRAPHFRIQRRRRRVVQVDAVGSGRRHGSSGYGGDAGRRLAIEPMKRRATTRHEITFTTGNRPTEARCDTFLLSITIHYSHAGAARAAT